MAAKRISGLYTPFNKLHKENVSMTDKVMRCMYATMNEGDTQVTHTGQVRCLIYSSEYSSYKTNEKLFYTYANNKIHIQVLNTYLSIYT